MPAPLLHIGYPKCLSSWMQKHLFVPDLGMELVTGPFLMQRDFVSIDPLRFDPDRFLASYPPAAAAGNTPVYSFENLAGNLAMGGYDATANAAKLKACFPDARILVVVREQAAMVRALYKSLVAWGSPRSLDELLSPEPNWRHLGPHFRLEALEYDGLIRHYHSLFGEHSVRVLCFEQFRHAPREFLDAVLTHAGQEPSRLDSATPPVSQVVNPGTSLWRIEKHRFANRLFNNLYNANGPLRETEDRQFRRVEKLRRAGSSPLDRWLSPRLERRFDERLRRALPGRFEPSNLQLAELTGLPLAEFGYAL